MADIGYARVSTRDQNVDAQTDQLHAAGCTKVYVDHASGTLAKRPALTEALDYLRAGDTLVVTKLDRLGLWNDMEMSAGTTGRVSRRRHGNVSSCGTAQRERRCSATAR